MENAKIAITAMMSRPHSTNDALNQAGVVEYRHTIRKEELAKAIKEGARIDQAAEVSPDDVQDVVDNLTDSKSHTCSNPKPKKKSRTSATGADPVDPEKTSHQAGLHMEVYLEIIGSS